MGNHFHKKRLPNLDGVVIDTSNIRTRRSCMRVCPATHVRKTPDLSGVVIDTSNISIRRFRNYNYRGSHNKKSDVPVDEPVLVVAKKPKKQGRSVKEKVPKKKKEPVRSNRGYNPSPEEIERMKAEFRQQHRLDPMKTGTSCSEGE